MTEPDSPTDDRAAPGVRTQFSLTERDLVNRLFGLLGLGARRARDLALRSLLLFVVTWVPLAVLALTEGLYSRAVEGPNFFADFAAYAQFFIALPVFVIGEAIVSLSTREAAKAFLSSGVIPSRLGPEIEILHRSVAAARQSLLAEAALILLAYVVAMLTIAPELCLSEYLCVSNADTWHSYETNNGVPHLTGAGWYAMLVALPVLNYWWLRWAWKIVIWTRYLYRISRNRMMLVASHPDRTGGIGFISRAQARFAWIIFAYGVSNVAAVVAYKVGVENASLTVMAVWGPMLGFAFIAPALFTVPLLMFTKQLFRTKKRALRKYRAIAMGRARLLENKWLNIGHGYGLDETLDLEQHTSFSELFEHVEKMRIVPFDFRSISQLFGSTLGSIATVIPLLGIESQLSSWLEFVASLFSHVG